jgi:energy-coupling factor transporter ATP-binding protein EcfA2
MERQMTTDEIAAAGAAENFGFEIRGLRVGDGELLDLPGPGNVIAVVGGNNVGKSTLLRQIKEILQSQTLTRTTGPRVVTELSEPWRGSAADMQEWVLAHTYHSHNQDGTLIVTRAGHGHALSDAMTTRQHPTPNFIADWFVNDQNALNRSYMCAPSERLDPVGAPPQHPMQVLHTDLSKRQEVEELAKRMFGITLHFDTVSKNVGFRVGDPGVAIPQANQIDLDYANAIALLPQLSDQGDGIKSSLGLVLPLITTEFPVSLIDEPEAFLHPPQARIIGSEIASLAMENQSQVFLATHDKHVLVGLVESGEPVTIVHLTRTDDETTATLLSSDDVAELWKDVTLRYGDALDGLFHRAVIVTESDRDSRFFHASIDSVQDAQNPKPPAHNVMFLGSNGKQNMAPIVTRLRRLGVRTVSCPDLDVLNKEGLISKLVEAHGGNWDDLKQLYKQATSEFKGTPPPPTVEKVRKRLGQVLDKTTDDETVTEILAERLADAVKTPKTKWSELKDYGDRAFKSDKAAATALLDALGKLGIVVVKVGVLENFANDVTAPKGPEFLPMALGAKVHENHDAALHAKRLLAAVGVKTGSAESTGSNNAATEPDS